MIAASLRDAEGDPIIELLLQKGADVNVKSVTGQVRCLGWFYLKLPISLLSTCPWLICTPFTECTPLRDLQNQHLNCPLLDRQ